MTINVINTFSCVVLFTSLVPSTGLFAADLRSSIPAGTEKMVELLQTVNTRSSPQQNPYLSEERAALLKTAIPQITNLQELLKMQDLYANTLLDAGKEAEALEAFMSLKFLTERSANIPAAENLIQRINMRIGTTYLRIGEQDNCLLNHTLDSCLLPISNLGIHKATFGSSSALDVFTAILESSSDQSDAEWLLNIAAMTLGKYPLQVPEQWRKPESYFKSDYDISRFVDVSGELGINVDDNSGGGIIDDFNGDGFLDIVVSAWGPNDPLHFFVNNGDGSYTERSSEAGLDGLTGGLNLIHADYNNDGMLDVFVLRGAWLGSQGNIPNSLLKNRGNGQFEDVTEQAGVLSFHPTQTACWLDFDDDGNLDLFVGNESNKLAPDHPSELYHNNGDGTFTNITESSGLDFRDFVKGVTSGDFDNDGKTDIYISVLGGKNKLFKNIGPAESKNGEFSWKFEDVSSAAGVSNPVNSFPTWFWDYDNDGWLDLFVSGYQINGVGDLMAEATGRSNGGEHPKLYRNNHDGTFTDVTKKTGIDRIMLAMGANFGDLDNDGWLDFYVGTGDTDFQTLVPNLMFRNDSGVEFQDVTTSGGFGHLQKGHGVSFGDFDEDGDQDVHAVMGGAYPADHYRNVLFQNPGHNNQWLKLKLVGVQSNRDAIGTRIKVNLRTPTGPRTIYRTVSTGGSFGGNPLRQEIGLGDALEIASVEIAWTMSRMVQTFSNLELNHHYQITEGNDTVEKVDLKPFNVDSMEMYEAYDKHHTPL